MARSFIEVICPGCQRKNTVYTDQKGLEKGKSLCYGSACKTPCFHDLLPLALELEKKKKLESKSS